MSSAGSSIEDLSAQLAGQWKPHATKPGTKDKPGTGKAVQSAGIITPEGTPDVDPRRVEADKERQVDPGTVEAADKKNSSGDQPPTSKEPQLPTKADDSKSNDEAAKEAEVLRAVLSCGPDEHHKILGIKEDYETGDEETAAIEAGVYDRGTMVHPKYNKDPNAEKAWNMIISAGKALGCRESVYQEVLNYVNEVLGDADADNDSLMEGIELQHPQPSKIILGLYEEATPFMDQLQQYPKSFTMRRKLDGINERIAKKNEEEGQDNKAMWLIDYDAISKFYEEVRPFVDQDKKNPGDQEILEGAKEVERKFNSYLAENHYPGAWTFKQDLLTREAVSARTEEAKKEMKNNLDARRKKMMEQRQQERPGDSATAAAEQPNRPSLTTSTHWTPGFTTKGEKIYAMQPYERTSKVTQEKSMAQCFFIVAKQGARKGQNSMVFEDSETIGPKATIGYLKQLPEADQIDIRTDKYTYSATDKMEFVEIDDIAVKPGYKPRVYPAICARVKYADGTYRYQNRTVLRKILGTVDADRRIEDFYTNNGLTIPWVKRAKRAMTVEAVQVVESVEETIAPQATEKPRRGRAPSWSPERRRSSSLHSNASSLSDEGLERLGGIENRMAEFETMIAALSSKLDKLR